MGEPVALDVVVDGTVPQGSARGFNLSFMITMNDICKSFLCLCVVALF